LPIIQSIGADLSLKHQITKQPVLPSEITMAASDNTVKGRRKKSHKAESSRPAQKEEGLRQMVSYRSRCRLCSHVASATEASDSPEDRLVIGKLLSDFGEAKKPWKSE